MIEIENRRSIRKYQATSVDDAIIMQLLESARLAPSGDNTQPWHYIVIDDKAMIDRVALVAHDQKWIRSAPVLIACVADIRARIKDHAKLKLDDDTGLFELKQIIRDTAISIEHIVLEAVHRGLGTCWISWFKQDEIRAVLGVPEDKFVVTILSLGYPDEAPKSRPRKDLTAIYHKNAW